LSATPTGKDKVANFFADRGSHTSALGAQFNAACVIAGLQALPSRPLAGFLAAGPIVQTRLPPE